MSARCNHSRCHQVKLNPKNTQNDHFCYFFGRGIWCTQLAEQNVEFLAAWTAPIYIDKYFSIILSCFPGGQLSKITLSLLFKLRDKITPSPSPCSRICCPHLRSWHCHISKVHSDNAYCMISNKWPGDRDGFMARAVARKYLIAFFPFLCPFSPDSDMRFITSCVPTGIKLEIGGMPAVFYLKPC